MEQPFEGQQRLVRRLDEGERIVAFDCGDADLLQDANTGLYYQSTGYVYSFLNSELSLCDYRR